MVFELLRTDVEGRKIKLPLGTYMIGNGELLECDNEEIPFNLGRITVSADELAIEPLHQYKLFFTEKGSKKIQVLKNTAGASVRKKMKNGDSFGLLRKSYWYEVSHYSMDKENEAVEDLNKLKVSHSKTINRKKRQKTKLKENQTNTSLESPNSANGSAKSKKRNQSPILKENDRVKRTKRRVKEKQSEMNTSSESLNSTNESAKSMKRSQSPILKENDRDKKTMREMKRKQNGVNTSSESLISTNDSAKSKKRSQNPEEEDKVQKTRRQSASKTVADLAPLEPRERCIYGATCYSLRSLRRGHCLHRVQFAHPRDPDWGAGTDLGELPECPLGLRCLRRGAQHWERYRHPLGKCPPGPVPRSKAFKCWRRHSILSESDSDTPVSPKLLRRRARKPLPEPAPDSDPEEEDPYATEGSDDWAPTEDDYDLFSLIVDS